MRIIAVMNPEGRSCKTTTAVNLATTLGEVHRVLLIDLDPEADAGKWLGVQKDEDEDDSSWLVSDRPLQDFIQIRHGPFSTVHVLSAVMDSEWEAAPRNRLRKRLLDMDQRFQFQAESKVKVRVTPDWSLRRKYAHIYEGGGTDKDVILYAAAQDPEFARAMLAPFEVAVKVHYESAAYRTVVIDCPSSYGHWIQNVLRAADEVIVPVDMQRQGYGIQSVLEFIEELRRFSNRHPFLVHILPCRVTKDWVDDLPGCFPGYEDIVLGGVRENPEVVAWYHFRADASMFDSRNPTARDFRGLCERVFQVKRHSRTSSRPPILLTLLQRRQEST